MEIWKNIPNWEDLYQISNFGRVVSLERTIINGNITYNKKERIVGHIDTHGYKRVILCYKNKKMDIIIAHLVKVLFNIKLKNFDSHTWDYGNRKGEYGYAAKLTKGNVIWIRKNRNKFSLRELGKKFNVSHEAINLIYQNKTWKDEKYRS